MATNLSFDPIRTEPAYRIAARALREKIVSGEIAVGSSLPSEMAMAELLSVNRSTVREAIRALEETGVVARRPGGKKLFVTAPPAATLSDRMTTAMVLHKITVEELWRSMLVLEPGTAALAAQFASDDQLATLDANLAATETQVNDAAAIAALDLAFHDLIAEASGNRAIQLARQPLGALFYPAFEQIFQHLNAGSRMAAAHRSIVDALKARDPATAEDWMRKHIIDFRRGWELAGLDLSAPVTAAP
ncbi:MAG: FCD domain-containing protein [Thalassobaculaceae bacterium]|nr:FCD domain-containing protein [Thalassobaculaceae bacterium]